MLFVHQVHLPLSLESSTVFIQCRIIRRLKGANGDGTVQFIKLLSLNVFGSRNKAGLDWIRAVPPLKLREKSVISRNFPNTVS